MIPSHPLRVSGVLVALLGLSLLSAVPANAGKEVFTRNKPHVNVSTSSTFMGSGGTQAARHDDPWRRRPKFKCVKPKESAALYCQ
jgi:hypothetical protein